MLSLLFLYANAVKFLETQWSKSSTCEGGPDSFRVFNVSNPKSFVKSRNDTLPAIYNFFAGLDGSFIYPYGVCGLARKGIHNECCYSSMDLSVQGTFGINSGGAYVIEPNNLMQSLPAAANGLAYCSLYSVLEGRLQGMDSIFYQANNASCYDGKVRCKTDGSLLVYPLINCQGIPIENNLANSNSSVSVADFGTFQGSLFTIQDQIITFGWKNIGPKRLLIPRHKYNPIVAIIYSLVLLGNTGVLSFSIYQYRNKFKQLQVLFIVVSQLLWFIWVIFKMVTVFTEYETRAAYEIPNAQSLVVLNMASLASVLYSTYFLDAMLKQKWYFSVALYILPAIMHILFAGGYYFSPAVALTLFSFWKQNGLLKWWFLFMFIWDTVPITFTAMLIVKSTSTSILDRFVRIHERDPYYWMTIALNIGIAIAYFLANSACYEYLWLNGDDQFYLFRAVMDVTTSAHCMIHFAMIERMKIVLDDRIRNTSSKVLSLEVRSTGKFNSSSKSKSIILTAPVIDK